MFDMLGGWAAALGGLLVFGAAYYIHQKLRLTRFACFVAVAGGLMVYNGQLGALVNQYAAELAIGLFCGMLILVAVIVADVKGKKKGADRPALFAYFLVPIFLVAFLSTLPAVLDQVSGGVQKTGTQLQQMDR